MTAKTSPCDPTGIVTHDTRDLLVCLIGLEHVAPAQRAKNTEDREQNRKDLAARQAQLGKALGHIIHRAARNGAIFVFVAVLHAQRTFGEFRRHAQQARDDHPERGARPPDPDSNRHTGDVTKTNRPGKRRGQSLKMADLTGIVRIGIVTFDKADRVSEETELHEGEVQRKDRSRDHQPPHDPRKTSSREGCEDKADERPG